MFSPLLKFQRQTNGRKKIEKWWLFHATNFQSLMYPCFTICRILGTFPYKINGLFFVISKPYYILSNIIMCVFCFSALMILYTINSDQWFNEYNVRRAIENNAFYITSSFIIIVTFVLSSPRMCLLQTIMKISSRLPSELYQKQSVLIHTKDIIGFFLLFAQALCYLKVQIPVLFNVLFLYSVLLVFQMDMLYINCVCVLKGCFKKINDDLTNLFINKLYLVKWINHPLLLMELKALKKRHLIISDTVQKLNILFSPQLLATIVASFFEITFEVYFNLIEWNNGLSINWAKKIDHTYAMFYVGYHFIKIVLIAWACETSKNEAVKISTTVHDILNITNDEEIAFELQLFSLQTMHCCNTFYAKGLILDATLITTVSNYLSQLNVLN
ncbi:uncharacterized protein LOC105834685 [Monomorium pharaonis]|uniref:uncharacterized protein LOC105834685 n=1 Tax=Monomorium pharaonis TaxID=307658 RepID=UPI0017477130|nr:uncharacterized protein LOC105834685 [Monomorium pharaonis]